MDNKITARGIILVVVLFTLFIWLNIGVVN